MTQDTVNQPSAGPSGGHADESVEANGADRTAGTSVLASAGMAAAICLVFIVSSLLIYDRLLRPATGVATIDIEVLVKAKEALVTDELNRMGAAGGPSRAYDLAGSFTRDLTSAIQDTQAECRCDIFVRAAVVSTPAIDLTQAVATRLGLRSDDVRAARDRLRGAIREAAPNLPGAPK
jgi:hypothetical protein